nr:MAG TPA: HeH/LEM domain [Caudoviricetes sp.]
MSKARLLDLARSSGVTGVTSAMRKAEIIEVIEGGAYA